MKIKHAFNPVIIATLFIAVVLSGCSSTPKIPDSVYLFDNLEQVKSVNNFRLDGWVKIDNRSLIVRSSPSKSYLMVLAYPNPDLRFNDALMISSTAGSVNANFDTVSVVSKSATNIPVPISAIYKISSRDEEKAVKAEIENRTKLFQQQLAPAN
ncbi:DUF6491 family protein [Sinobacterium caligoides]|uniref:DUF6491 family protein n=1 Tax=Sinobacterium caligoides TaxID=933926 RepID=UPI0011CD4BA2|nr:DUF6491 family protein [Sinobacterium caligoides]